MSSVKQHSRPEEQNNNNTHSVLQLFPMNFHPANLEALMSIFSKKSIISFIFKDSFVKKYLLPSSGHGRAAKALGHMGACLRLRGTRKISYLLSEKSSLNFTELAAVIKIAFSCLFFSIQFDYEIRQSEIKEKLVLVYNIQ